MLMDTNGDTKMLLLKDLCSRLPYGVKVRYHYKRNDKVVDEDRELDFSDVETLKYNNENSQDNWCEISWKPYLRPMSSMTEEERGELRKFCRKEEGIIYDIGVSGAINAPAIIDYLNANHFDYRGLIEKCLAIEAPVDMYKLTEK